MTNNKGMTTIVTAIIIIAVLVIAAGVIWYVTTGNDNINTNLSNTNNTTNHNANLNENVNAMVNENMNTNTNSSLNTSDWKTYTNEKYGYSVKYPNNYRVMEGDIYIHIYSYPEENSYNPGSPPPQDEIKIVISIYNDLNQKLDDWIESFGYNVPRYHSLSPDVAAGSAETNVVPG